ncbi:hypothetical protein JCM8547_007446 [Rhodosporidiobolus lusitaniae]
MLSRFRNVLYNTVSKLADAEIADKRSGPNVLQQYDPFPFVCTLAGQLAQAISMVDPNAPEHPADTECNIELMHRTPIVTALRYRQQQSEVEDKEQAIGLHKTGTAAQPSVTLKFAALRLEEVEDMAKKAGGDDFELAVRAFLVVLLRELGCPHSSQEKRN